MKKILLFIPIIIFSATVCFAQAPDPKILAYSNNEIAVGYAKAEEKLLILEPSYSGPMVTVKEIGFSPDNSISIYSDPILEEMFLYFGNEEADIIKYNLDENQEIVGERENYGTDRLWFSLLNLGDEKIAQLQNAFVEFFENIGVEISILEEKKKA